MLIPELRLLAKQIIKEIQIIESRQQGNEFMAGLLLTLSWVHTLYTGDKEFANIYGVAGLKKWAAELPAEDFLLFPLPKRKGE